MLNIKNLNFLPNEEPANLWARITDFEDYDKDNKLSQIEIELYSEELITFEKSFFRQIKLEGLLGSDNNGIIDEVPLYFIF